MNASKTLVAVALLAPAVALANGYSLPNVNARDLGAAGALVAAQRDAAATWQNPAALSKLDGLDLSFSASLLVNSTTWRGRRRGSQIDRASPPRRRRRCGPRTGRRSPATASASARA